MSFLFLAFFSLLAVADRATSTEVEGSSAERHVFRGSNGGVAAAGSSESSSRFDGKLDAKQGSVVSETLAGQGGVTQGLEVKKSEKLPSDETEGSTDGAAVSTKQAPTFALLLTTYNTEEREAMYTMRLQWWLRWTQLPVYVVDSAGRGFPASLSKIRSFKQLKFDQHNASVRRKRLDSTLGELLSMRLAWATFKDDWSRFDYVVKVTGKYVFPDLESEMQKVSKGNSFIIERFTDHPDAGYLRWVNTECLGFSAARMGDFLDKLLSEQGALEDRLGQMLVTGHYPSQQLNWMRIPEGFQTKRGAGDVLTAVLQTSDRKKRQVWPSNGGFDHSSVS